MSSDEARVDPHHPCDKGSPGHNPLPTPPRDPPSPAHADGDAIPAPDNHPTD
jgi:hypothetical protein